MPDLPSTSSTKPPAGDPVTVRSSTGPIIAMFPICSAASESQLVVKNFKSAPGPYSGVSVPTEAQVAAVQGGRRGRRYWGHSAHFGSDPGDQLSSRHCSVHLSRSGMDG